MGTTALRKSVICHAKAWHGMAERDPHESPARSLSRSTVSLLVIVESDSDKR